MSNLKDVNIVNFYINSKFKNNLKMKQQKFKFNKFNNLKYNFKVKLQMKFKTIKTKKLIKKMYQMIFKNF